MNLEQIAQRLWLAWERSHPRHRHGRELTWDEIGDAERRRWVQVARAAAYVLATGVDAEVAREMGWDEHDRRPK